MSVKCDRGATAHSALEGDVTWTVMACTEGFAFWKYGLQGCGVDTGAVGSYALTFFVEHGDSRTEVTRTLRVLEKCRGVVLLPSFI